MASPASLGWAAALASLGQAAPGIARQYNKDLAADAEADRNNKLRASTQSILQGMPQYGSVLEEFSGSMPPDQAQEVLARTSPEDRQAAVDIMAGKRGLDSLRLAMPEKMPDLPTPPGGALGAMLQPARGRSRKDIIEQIRPIIRDMESGGRYGIAHPRAKSGKQAMGAYGIVPEIWFPAFPDFKLDHTNPEHRKRFLEDPAIQDAMFSTIAERGLEETGGDLRKFRAWYYGGPSAVSALDSDAGKRPEYAYDAQGKLISMPSRTDDADDFMRRLQEAGLDPSAAMAETPAMLPWDNSLLADLVKEPPKRAETMPRKVSYGDQERYILSKVTNPEQMAMLKDILSPISALAKAERDREDKQSGRYGENVRADARLKFDTWKEERAGRHRDRTYRDQSIQALRAQRDSMQKQLQDIRSFQTRVSSGKESPEMLAAAYPDFFTTRSTDPGFLAQLLQGDEATPGKETAFDTARFTEAIRALEADIQAIDQALSTKSGAPVSAPAGAPNPLSKYLTPRN